MQKIPQQPDDGRRVMHWPYDPETLAETAAAVKPMLDILFRAIDQAPIDKAQALALNILINLTGSAIAVVTDGDGRLGAAVIDAIGGVSKEHLDIACAAMDRDLEERLDAPIADVDMAEAGALIERLRGRQ